jgi:hypothetical protein
MRVAVIVPMMKAVVFPAESLALSENVPLKEFPSADKVTASMIRIGPKGQRGRYIASIENLPETFHRVQIAISSVNAASSARAMK